MVDSVGKLEVHILGAGIGESIVVRLPRGAYGVIDCYAPKLDDRSTNATWCFLKERNVTELEFLCLTHPHRDHYRGMSHLLETFRVRYFWRFNALSQQELCNLIKCLKRDGDEEERKDADDLLETFRLVKQSEGRTPILRTGMRTELYPVGNTADAIASIRVSSIAPSGDQVDRYERSLKLCFNDQGTLRKRISSVRHNDVSSALLIEFGKTRVILGGDVETCSWQDTLDQVPNDGLRSLLVKVSHHGSLTGYCDRLWELFCNHCKTFAVIVPYNQQRLPDMRAVEHIKKHAHQVFVTSRSGIAFSAGISVFPDTLPLDGTLALQSVFRQFLPKQNDGLGTCSFIFDSEGRCQVTRSGQADIL